jgi:hypothetical protein
MTLSLTSQLESHSDKKNLLFLQALVRKGTSTSPSHTKGSYEQENVAGYFKKCPLRVASHFSGFVN